MSGMKFSMEADALGHLIQQGEGNNSDLRVLVQNLVAAAEPLVKTFNGPAKAAFNNLKANADTVAAQLHNSHTGLMNSATEQDKAFILASNEAMDLHNSTNSSVDFTAAVAKNV